LRQVPSVNCFRLHRRGVRRARNGAHVPQRRACVGVLAHRRPPRGQQHTLWTAARAIDAVADVGKRAALGVAGIRLGRGHRYILPPRANDTNARRGLVRAP
jgi:hypothetical protein